MSNPSSTSMLQSAPTSQTSDQPVKDTLVDDEVFVGFHTNMHYECFNGLADTAIYSPPQGHQQAVLVDETVSLVSPWSATSEEVNDIPHTEDLEQGSTRTDFFCKSRKCK